MNPFEISVRKVSWIHPSLVCTRSQIHGQGVITTEPLEPYTIVMEWGGVLLSNEAVLEGSGVQHTLVAISEDHWLSAENDGDKTIDDFVNHSCSPNIGMLTETALVTMKSINKGEEITADYCIWLNDDSYIMSSSCRCGAKNCRGTIRGSDWRKRGVQEALLPFFSPFLRRRVVEMTIA